MTNPDPEFSSKASRKPLIAQAQNIFRQLVTSDYFIKVTETFTTRIILILLSLLTGVIIARTLGPEGRGVYAMAVLLGTMGVQLTNLGLHSSNTFYVARDSNLLSKLLGNSLLVSFGFGSFASWLAWVLFKNFPNLAPVDEPLLFLGLLWIPFGLSYLLAQNLLLGMQNFKAYNKF